ncbi:MAG: siderophore-interacting protein [Chloroflexota bacterium]
MKLKRRSDRRAPRLLIVDRVVYVTPNMIRVTFAGDVLKGIPMDCAGANCKLMLPETDQDRKTFEHELNEGPKPTTRTYTVRAIRPDPLEMDIDFVAHGENGPASKWAMNAKPGDFCGFAGPGTAKITEFYADWYLIAADMSALPVAGATLEAMPDDAKGVAIFEVLCDEDIQDIDTPAGIESFWIVTPDPYKASYEQEALIRKLDWPEGVIQTCIAGESSVIRSLRDYIHNEKKLARKDTYISGYWKIGLIEDEHQALKRQNNNT